MKAIDLITGHSIECGCPPEYTAACPCSFYARQQAAREIDARVEALAVAVRGLSRWVCHTDECSLTMPLYPDPVCDCGADEVRARIDALLAKESPHG